MDSRRIPELLAPAGNPVTLHAAVSAGADAVYLGMGEFNARRNANNFTNESLEEGCRYAHLRGASIYVTMNTIILPSEMDAALRCSYDCLCAGADAFIVQDLGLALGMKRAFPDVRLHASTQMSTMCKDGIEGLHELGFRRATLAREMSIPEIAELGSYAESLGMEVESFAHGALCVCYSGQCLMSSMIGGRSANRGLCAQACRLPYKLHNMNNPERELRSPGEFLLSPKDLCSIDELEALAQAGVASLKIEGRMKSPEYVNTVVSAYRAALDSIALGGGRFDFDEARTKLGSVFSRGFTTAYLNGKRGNDIMSYQRPNNRGQFIGRVKSARESQVVIAAEKGLSQGDLLEVWTKRGNVKFEVTKLPEQRSKNVAIDVDDASKIRGGDRVFRIRSAEAAFRDNDNEPRIPVVGKAVLQIGKPLRVEFSTIDGLHEAFAEGDIVEPARTKSVTEEDVRKHVDRLGQTPFKLEGLEVILDDGVGIGFSKIHHVRAQALENLQGKVLHQRKRQKPDKPATVQAAQRPSEVLTAANPQITVLATNPEGARAAKRVGANSIYVPLLNYKRGQSQTSGVLDSELAQAGFPKQSILMVPSVVHDSVGSSREAELEADVWANVVEGQRVCVESLAALVRAQQLGCAIEVGPTLPVTNQLSVSVMAAFGVERIWLSPELNLSQIESLVAASKAAYPEIEFGIKVAGAQELMVTEHCMLMSQGDCAQNCPTCSRRKVPHALEDRLGYHFPVVTDALGRSHLYNSVELDNVPAVSELISAGISCFMLDSTLLTPEQTAQATGRLAKAVQIAQEGGDPLPKANKATTGHLFRGVM